MIIYRARSSGQSVVLSDDVLAHLSCYRQVDPAAEEGGGQLFATFQTGAVVLEKATGPRSSDRRSRFWFHPNRQAERREIKQQFKLGRHYVGDWHTHPERMPRPSGQDIASFHDLFRNSRHGLANFVMIIVGTLDPPEGLYVGLFDHKHTIELDPLGDAGYYGRDASV